MVSKFQITEELKNYKNAKTEIQEAKTILNARRQENI
jgi:hypothetical protein